MIDNRHFQRLEHLYSTAPSGAPERHHVAVALGRAELSSRIESEEMNPQERASHSHYHKLLCDAATLAAGSLVEDRLVAAEQFNMQVLHPGYSGAVSVVARVALAQPPRYHVEARLLNADGEVLAEGAGVFAPSTVELPPDPHPKAESTERARRDPAVYASVWASPFGLLHLN